MTYNISVTPGSGETVAADQVIDPDLGTVKEQVIKIADGTLGGTGRMTVTSGNAHVDVQTSVLPTGASTSANQASEITQLTSLNTIEGTTTGAAVTTDSNATLQQYQRGLVKMISDMWSSGNHWLQVSIQNATLAVTQSGNWSSRTQDGAGTSIGSDDTTTVAKHGLNINVLDILGTAPSTAGKLDIKVADGDDTTLGAKADSAITDSTTTNTLMSFLKGAIKIWNDVWDSTNHKIKVDSSGSTSTVSGTVTANAGTNLNTSLLALESGNLANVKTDLDNISGAVTSSKMAVKSADGDEVTIGAKADTAITDSTTTNTHMSFLKGLVKIFNDVWVSGSHWLQVSIMNSTLAVTQSGNWSQRLQDGSGTAITSNSTSGSGTVGVDVNIRSIINGVPSASGKLDIKSADGDQVTIGVTTGAAVVTDTTGTLQGYIRGLNKALVASVWDSTNAWLNIRRVKKDTFSTSAFTITLASLANGSGRQSTLITNTSPGTESALITVKFTVGTSPTVNSTINVYLLRGDGTITDDGAGASDAAITIINAPLLGVIICNATTSNVAYYGVFDTKSLGSLGPNFGIAVVNNTGVTANATGGNFTAQYTLMS